ncbi:MAG: site-2 protease family protein [Acidobacteria bacterium]|nr:site-2 protease family protein [Acidobacteriota bacterium]
MPEVGQLLVLLPVLLLSLTIHETAHAATADWYGDPTARRLGRISLNPVVHVDPVGTVILPLIGILAGGFVFGWAKPVPVNPANLRRPRQDFLVIAAAGPASNILLAVGASWLLAAVGLEAAGGWAGAVATFAFAMLQLNLLLAVFNMIPVPPLDGGNVLAGLLPAGLADAYDRLVRPYGFLILLVLMATGGLYRIIGPPMSLLMGWLLP